MDSITEPECENSNDLSKTARSIEKRAFPKVHSASGKIVMQIVVNKNGDVVYAKYLKEKSTIKDDKVIASVLDAMRKTKFTPDPDAPETECSLWTVNLKSLE